MRNFYVSIVLCVLYQTAICGPDTFLQDACSRMPTLRVCQRSGALSDTPGGPQGGQQPVDSVYCRSYNNDYRTFCNSGPAPQFAAGFCQGYYTQCPGAPPPGSGTPPNAPQPTGPPPGAATPAPGGAGGPGGPTGGPAGPGSGTTPAPGAKGNPKNTPKGGKGATPSPAGGKSPQGSPSLPTGGLPNVPKAPTGPAGILAGMNQPTQTPQFGGSVPGGIGLGTGFNAPFTNYNNGANIVPTKGVQTGTNVNAAGANVGLQRSVDFSGLPFMSNINSILGVPGGGMGAGSPMGGLGSVGGFGRKKRSFREMLLRY